MDDVLLDNVHRLHVRVSGLVQGVGFRPFVYRTAGELGLSGFVENDDRGVDIEVEGPREALDDFLGRIGGDAPPLVRVSRLEVSRLAPVGTVGFQIRASERHGIATTRISPDVAICDDCLRELFDPADRRYRYPFINCTNCGPRYTIVEGIPYDRPLTSMKGFAMCPDCSREYRDPLNRRFHAQPNACRACGPQVAIVDGRRKSVETNDPFATAQDILQSGLILAVKGLGGFHLAVNPHDDAAVRRLRERKGRAEKPFALMAPDVATVVRYCNVNSAEERALLHRSRPIVLLEARDGHGLAPSVAPFGRHSDKEGSLTSFGMTTSDFGMTTSDFGMTTSGSGIPEGGLGIPEGGLGMAEGGFWMTKSGFGMQQLGFMLAYTPLHFLLLGGPVDVLVMTSANMSEEPIAVGNEEAFERLGDIADYFVIHDRDILQRCDDSVVRVMDGVTVPIRRSRGFVPDPVALPVEAPRPILSCGGELKNTIGLTRGTSVILSQHVGDLDNPAAYRGFEHTIAHLQSILEIESEVIAYDMHPEYLSTKWAREQTKLKPIVVQHHHAHLAAVMAENGVTDPTIGIILDGTGYGTDGTIWGGEVLVGDLAGFTRFAWLRPFPLPGGEAAIRHPWRTAYALVREALATPSDGAGLALIAGQAGAAIPAGAVPPYREVPSSTPPRNGRERSNGDAGGSVKRADHTQITDDFVERILPFTTTREREVFDQVLRRGINVPLTSSCGRLFDGISALLGLCREVTFEAQAAMALELAADPEEEWAYAVVWPTARRASVNGDSRDPRERSSSGPLDWTPILRGILADLKTGTATPAIAGRFHLSLADLFVDAAVRARAETGINRVGLSGGVFQNKLLFADIRKKLARQDFEVLTHRLVPANDGGLAYGQAAVAAQTIQRDSE